MVATISAATLADLRRQGRAVHVIDVRTPAEFGEVHVDCAHNIPLDRLDPRDIESRYAGGPVYVVCKSGNRSQKACEKLLAAGMKDVISIEGGTAACEAAGIPVIRGRKVMSLERQVRIAAGALVATGAALAAFGPDAPVNWQAIGAGLAGFVGCGLVFAGVTDTCGMAMLIARMPWNQARRAATTCSRMVLLGLVLTMLGRGADPQELAVTLPKDKIIYCYCLAGGRCEEAAAILKPLGYDVRALKPGYPQLVKAGFPAASGK